MPFSLKNHNTLAIDVNGEYLESLDCEAKLSSIKIIVNSRKPNIVLGQGSNVLFSKDYQGTVILNRLTGIDIINENNTTAVVKVAAGENWHNFVSWTLKNKLFGLENLSLIPGTVGAAPVQNIGAYGVELATFVSSVSVLDLKTVKSREFSFRQCKFAYRNSIFKQNPDQYLITSVTFKLEKIFKPILIYPGVIAMLEKMGHDVNCASAIAISDAICKLRNSKLPQPSIIANAGSFFKNPIVSDETHKTLSNGYANLVANRVDENNVKLSAAWLIEYCGWKGFRRGDAGVHENHALVIVNYANATGGDILNLANDIKDSVKQEFAIELEPEPRII